MTKQQHQDLQMQEDVRQNVSEEILGENDSNAEILKLEQNYEIPFQEYRYSFPVFHSRRKASLATSYRKIKSEQHLNALFQQLLKFEKELMNITPNSEIFSTEIQNNRNPQLQEHHFLCKVPQNITIFVKIYGIDQRRCNAIVMNASGFIYTYFYNLRIAGKFNKIYKILKKIPKPFLFIMHDCNSTIQTSYFCIKKISELATDYCYYSDILQDLPLKFSSKLISENNVERIQKSTIWINKGRFYYFSQKFYDQNNIFQNNLTKILQVQKGLLRDNKFFSQDLITTQNFIWKCITVNFSKSKVFQSTKQLFTQLKKMFQAYQQIQMEKKSRQIAFGDPKNHYLQKMKACKYCIYCSNVKQKSNYQSKKLKTKYRCEGCSALNKKDIPLCIVCVSQYHIQVQKLNRKKQINRKKNQSKSQSNNKLKSQQRIGQSLFIDNGEQFAFCKLEEQSPFSQEIPIEIQQEVLNSTKIENLINNRTLATSATMKTYLDIDSQRNKVINLFSELMEDSQQNKDQLFTYASELIDIIKYRIQNFYTNIQESQIFNDIYKK